MIRKSTSYQRSKHGRERKADSKQSKQLCALVKGCDFGLDSASVLAARNSTTLIIATETYENNHAPTKDPRGTDARHRPPQDQYLHVWRDPAEQRSKLKDDDREQHDVF